MNNEKAKKKAEYEEIIKYGAGREAVVAFRHKAFCVRDLAPIKGCQNQEMVFTCNGCNKCGRFNNKQKTESVTEYCKRKGIRISG